MNEQNSGSKLIEKEFTYTDNLTSIERLKSMLFDHFLICCTVLPIVIFPLLLLDIFDNEYKWIDEILMIFVLGIYLNKDVFRGRSVAKRILGQVVIDVNTGKPANGFKCLFRNFTSIFWVFEVIIVSISPNRRMGDIIVGTKVVRVNREDAKNIIYEFQNSEREKWILPLGIAIACIVLISNFFW